LDVSPLFALTSSVCFLPPVLGVYTKQSRILFLFFFRFCCCPRGYGLICSFFQRPGFWWSKFGPTPLIAIPVKWGPPHIPSAPSFIIRHPLEVHPDFCFFFFFLFTRQVQTTPCPSSRIHFLRPGLFQIAPLLCQASAPFWFLVHRFAVIRSQSRFRPLPGGLAGAHLLSPREFFPSVST